jgi:RNA polymerase sigma factor (sigma-70 family)
MGTGQMENVVGYLRTVAGADRDKNLEDRELLRRFAETREEQAFAVLMRRHGRMVWGVCRHVLGHDQDGEDAFQATFLTLACRAGSIRKAEAVASWLHGTAYRIALRAKRDAATRRARESRGGSMARERTPAGNFVEALALLDEEVARLSDKQRAVFILCHLEGKSRQEAARQLGWKEGTVAGTLARACRQLRRRLASRGVTLSALLGVLALGDGSSAAVPLALTKVTLQTAQACAAGKLGASTVASATVLALAQGACKTMILNKLKVVSVFLLAVLLAGGSVAAYVTGAGAGSWTQGLAAGQAKPRASASANSPAVEPKPSAEDDKADSVVVRGQVVDPDGKPFGGAKVLFVRYSRLGKDAALPTVISDSDGRFRLHVSRTGYEDGTPRWGDFEKRLWLRGAVVALGKGFGFGWVGDDNVEKLTDVTIKLVRDVPIEGRVLDLEGKPVSGVNVRLQSVEFRESGGSLVDFVVSGQSKVGLFGGKWPATRVDPAVLHLTRTTATGADGKYRFTGISGECVVKLRFEGPTIETAEERVLTRPIPAIHEPAIKNVPGSRGVTYHGSVFDHAAAPTRPIEGVVRDKDTGKPLAGVTIQNETFGPGKGIQLSAVTDQDGRYRITGLSREPGQSLLAEAPEGQHYLRAALTSKAVAGLGPLTLDFNLKRGVVISGRVTDLKTGRPVPARVEYFVFNDNPFLREAPGFRNSPSIDVRTDADGFFTIVGLPGRSLIAARSVAVEGRHLMAVGADKIQGLEPESCNTYPNCCDANRFNTLVEISPARDAKTLACAITLDPGKTVSGTIMGPDGQPVKGASIDSVNGIGLSMSNLPTDRFNIQGIDPKLPRAFYFRDHEKKLGAAVLLTGDEKMPVTIRLQKCATITGRLVDEDGRPCAAILMGHIHKGQLNINSGVGAFNDSAGKDGRFRIEGLIPGLKIGIWAGKNFMYFDQHIVEELTLQEGEVKDLGDLVRKVMD